MLYESELPVAPLGVKEMLSLLLKDPRVKWAALSHRQEFGFPGACCNHRSKERNQTAPHTERQQGKQAGPQRRRTSKGGKEQSSEISLCIAFGLAAGMLLWAEQEAAVEVIPMAFPGEHCRKASQVEAG